MKSHSFYLIRHAIAEDRGDKWPDDRLRPLTHKGMARMRQGVRGLKALGVEIDLLLTSPLVRARQTADIVIEGMKPTPDLEVVPALSPGTARASVSEALGNFAKAQSIAVVGHEPDLGELARWLIGARAPLPFKKGGVCRIDTTGGPTAGSGQVVWFATPAMLRAVAATVKS
jgi:phosphohistidine phosphatase